MDTKQVPQDQKTDAKESFQSASHGAPVVFKADDPGSKSSIKLPSHSLKLVLAGFVMLFLVGGVGVGVYLVGQQQQLNSKAFIDPPVPDNLNAVVPSAAIVTTATPSAQASRAAISDSTVPEGASSFEATTSAEVEELNQLANDLENINASSSAQEESYDFNGDGLINSIDLSTMYANWGASESPEMLRVDLNLDGTINGLDYSLFVKKFNQQIDRQ